MSTHNIGFSEEISNLSLKYHQIHALSDPLSLYSTITDLQVLIFSIASMSSASNFSIVLSEIGNYLI